MLFGKITDDHIRRRLTCVKRTRDIRTTDGRIINSIRLN